MEGISQSEENKEKEETNDAEAEDQKEGGDETSNEKETSVTGEEQATAAEESNYGSGEAEISSGPHMLYIEQEGSQTVKTRLTTQLGGTTRSTTQPGDMTRLMEQIGGQASTSSRDAWNEVTRGGSQTSRGPFMPHTEREGSQTGTNTTRTSMQPGDMTRPTTLEGTVLKRTKKKSGKFPNNFDVTDNARGEVIEDANYDRVVWNVEDEEESSESPVEDRDKTMTTTWDVMELDANTTFLQGETIDGGGCVILLKELCRGVRGS